MLAEFFESFQHDERIFRIHVQQLVGEELEPERFEQGQDSLG